MKSTTEMMQPSRAKEEIFTAFEELGRASVHIVHDLKNQLNGLKLYATFLRKRLDRDERPADERETIIKLMAGLDRAANDLTAIVRYAKPPELRRWQRIDLVKIIAQALERSVTDSAAKQSMLAAVGGIEDSFYGEFDPGALVGAIEILIQQVTTSIRKDTSLSLTIIRVNESSDAMIEFRYVDSARDEDPFRALEGIASLRTALATRTIKAHGGRFEHDAKALRIWLPLIS